MRKLHKKPLVLAAAAIALTGSLTVGSAMAYFTTYATAGGGVKMNMGFTTTVPDEKIDEKGKHVTINNEGDYDCFVRVKAFAPVALTYLAPDGGWQAYQFPSGDGKASEFNVVVIQECTPVLFDENGNAYADWNHAVTADSGDTQE